jgi:hypothetical protein
MGFTKFEYEGQEYWIGKENEVLAKIKKKMSKVIEFGPEARKTTSFGIDKLADAVVATWVLMDEM